MATCKTPRCAAAARPRALSRYVRAARPAVHAGPGGGPRVPRVALGDISSVLSEAVGAIGTAATVAQDPYFGEVLCRIDQLHRVRTHQPPGLCADTPPSAVSSVGLDNVAMGLRAYVFAEENPWVYPVAVAVVLGIPFLLGLELGK